MKNKRILVIGSSNTDMTAKTKSLPVPGQTVLGGVFTMGPGGKGANQAVAAARLGADVAFVCKVGRDIFGRNAVEGYEKEGLDTTSVLYSDQPSGVALISVDENGENCIVVAPGANMDFSISDIDACAHLIKTADILLLQLEIPIPVVLHAAKIAHEAGVLVVLNPAPYAELPEEIFSNIDLFIPNETELSAFAGVKVESVEDAAAACRIMQAKGVGKLIVTLGSKGSMIFDGGQPVCVAAQKVKAVDTTAAGDTFCGALCVALSEGKSLAQAAEFASAASAISVTRMGAQMSMPYRNEIQ